MNMGNTCFLNSTMQALFHVRSVLQYFQESCNHHHVPKCLQLGIKNCITCAVKHTLSESINTPVLKPTQLVKKLSLICNRMVVGYQQDAHEYLRYAQIDLN